MRRRTLLLSLAAGPVAGPVAAALAREPAAAATDYPTSQLLADQVMLWPGTAPGSEGLDLTEQITERSTYPRIHDRVINGVTQPSIVPFFPPPGTADGSAVLICPGGGYLYSAFDVEGYDVAQWLTSIGVTAFVLKYRLPAEGHQRGYDVPLEDGQRAIRVIRARAEQWGLDPDRVGAIGFSAGGHLASTLATRFAKTVYDPVDDADGLSARPGFVMLAYPVVSMKTGITHSGTRNRLIGTSPTQEMIDEFSNEEHVTAQTPPTFGVQADDDRTASTLNSTLFYEALHAAKVSAELHLFRKGGHGFGLRNAHGSLALWTVLADEWLAASGFIGGLSQGDVFPTVQTSLADIAGQSRPRAG